MTDRPSPSGAPGEESRNGPSSNGQRALKVASSINLLFTVAIPAVLALFGLVIGIATASLPLVLVAVVVGIFAAYAWIRRVRAGEPR